MNVILRDREPFEQLNPAEVAAYLRSMGWQEVEHQPDRVSVWVTPAADDLEILLPLRRSLGDFAARMADAVGTLAAHESRSQLEILADLQTAGADVVRIRYRHASATDGSIPLDQGEALVENAREMLLAGACAAVQPKALYLSRRPEEANRFVRGLRLGQTERGSYVLTVYSRVGPSFAPTLPTLEALAPPPFERRAVTQLATALTALRTATDRALTTSSPDGFHAAVAAGVSANLCAAVVGMSGPDSQPGDELRVSFTYARSRPADPLTPREVVIPGDHVPTIAEAARLFRASAPPEEAEIRGAVVQLKRDELKDVASGPVTVMAFVEGRPRKVQIALDAPSHALAVQAYERGAEIACTGDLVKQSSGWVLQNPKGFAVAPDEN